jgi:hypothetical protein
MGGKPTLDTHTLDGRFVPLLIVQPLRSISRKQTDSSPPSLAVMDGEQTFIR